MQVEYLSFMIFIKLIKSITYSYRALCIQLPADFTLLFIKYSIV